MRLSVEKVCQWVRGDCINNCQGVFTGICIDSRKIRQGELFVALKGQNHDGHTFISQAIEAGASGVIVEKGCWNQFNLFPQKTFIIVNDSYEALTLLAKNYRLQFSIPIIGITGSVGKTTTKEMTAAILNERFNTLKNYGNFNNEIGVPLTLLSLDESHTAAVVEMGMRGLGQIAHLASIVHPNIALVTNVGETHIEKLGSIENIFRAKKEIVDSLPQNGIAVLNGDDPWVRKMAPAAPKKVIFYGMGDDNDVRGAEIEDYGEDGIEFTLSYLKERERIFIPIMGRHNVINALGAAGAAFALGMGISQIKTGLSKIQGSGMRAEIINLPKNIKIVNDAYNASPASMRAAFDMLERIEAKRKIAVLGDMLELGEESSRLHWEVGKYLAQKNISILLTYGERAEKIAAGAKENGFYDVYIFSSKGAVLEKLQHIIKEGDCILFKASRGMKLEEIIEGLKSLN